ncbi:MAG: DEAD/DEAH box helicase, partial [Gemmatimonadaceae bacterium]
MTEPRASKSIDIAERWFVSRGWQPLAFQREVWQAYLQGESGLVHAATGTGKTLAAWWGPLLEWLDAGNAPTAKRPRRSAAPPLRVLWITPLRALAADTLASLA